MEPLDDRLFCRRCAARVEVIRPWPHWRLVLYVWYGSVGVLAILSPIMASDYCAMIPTMMGIVLAGSPLHRLAKERPVCTVCSLELADEAR